MVAPDSCATRETYTISGTNWSGKFDHCAAGYCTKSSGVFTQPNILTGSCTNASLGSFTGLTRGTAGTGGILQAGVGLPVGTNSPYAFWEYINGVHSAGSVAAQKFTQVAVHP